jgi:hypothetical protein
MGRLRPLRDPWQERIEDAVRRATPHIGSYGSGLEAFRRDIGSKRWATDCLRDSIWLAPEAERMLSHGPNSELQNWVLVERYTKFVLNGGFDAGLRAYADSDPFARLGLPSEFITERYRYDEEKAARAKACREALLAQLEADFRRDGNPVHVLQAVAIAGIDDTAFPDWVREFLVDSAERILELREAVVRGKRVDREADSVGKALGFGTGGPGSGGWFKRSTMLARDREIHSRVRQWIERARGQYPDREPKLTSAYYEVAGELHVDPSTVQRAYAHCR